MQAAASALVIEQGVAEVVSALREAGVRAVLLKGASFERWLYDPDEPRMYGDIDLLVRDRDLGPAAEVLTELGYRRWSEELAPRHTDHAKVWIRAADKMEVDLHRSLIGVEAHEVDPWTVLNEETELTRLGDTDVEVLSEPARAMHVALHAAAHGKAEEKTLLDLSRALERVAPGTWARAAALSKRLGAEGAFATGLRLLPEGSELAARLELTAERSVETAMFAESVPYESWTVNRLANTPGLVPKLRIALRRTFPEPDFMRAWHPIARRGWLGLAMSYVRRLGWLLTATGPAVWRWWRARQKARRSA